MLLLLSRKLTSEKESNFIKCRKWCKEGQESLANCMVSAAMNLSHPNSHFPCRRSYE